jgi:polyisoprenoid-binding protein YceI
MITIKLNKMETQEVLTKTKWIIDHAHSEIGFKVKHLVFSNVRGVFKYFDTRVYTNGDDFSSAEINVWIDPASVHTGTEPRDQHLRSADFFDVEQFCEISFAASRPVASNRERHFDLYGVLAMKGIKKEIRLDVEFGALIKDPWGVEKALFSINGKINRKDWGLNYNQILESGGVLVGEEILIQCEVQLIKQAENHSLR